MVLVLNTVMTAGADNLIMVLVLNTVMTAGADKLNKDSCSEHCRHVMLNLSAPAVMSSTVFRTRIFVKLVCTSCHDGVQFLVPNTVHKIQTHTVCHEQRWFAWYIPESVSVMWVMLCMYNITMDSLSSHHDREAVGGSYSLVSSPDVNFRLGMRTWKP